MPAISTAGANLTWNDDDYENGGYLFCKTVPRGARRAYVMHRAPPWKRLSNVVTGIPYLKILPTRSILLHKTYHVYWLVRIINYKCLYTYLMKIYTLKQKVKPSSLDNNYQMLWRKCFNYIYIYIYTNVYI